MRKKFIKSPIEAVLVFLIIGGGISAIAWMIYEGSQPYEFSQIKPLDDQIEVTRWWCPDHFSDTFPDKCKKLSVKHARLEP